MIEYKYIRPHALYGQENYDFVLLSMRHVEGMAYRVYDAAFLHFIFLVPQGIKEIVIFNVVRGELKLWRTIDEQTSAIDLVQWLSDVQLNFVVQTMRGWR